MQKVIFVHIPRAGGTTMKYILASAYGKSLIHEKQERNNVKRALYYDKPLLPFNYTDEYSERYKCIIGHFPLSKYRHLKRDGWKFATWLRDPVERLISIWSKRGQGMANSIEELSLVLSDSYKIYLDDLDILDFVGFTETYKESLRDMEKVLGIKTHWYGKRNITPNRLTITDKEREIVKNNLKSDYEVYNKLCGRQIN